MRCKMFVGKVLLVAWLSCWGWQAAKAVDAPKARQTEAALQERIKAVEAQVKDSASAIEARQNETDKRLLEKERKSIDWWVGALAVLTTIVAALGAVLPYFMGRKDKELLQSELQNARDLVESIKQQKLVAEKDAGEISQIISEYQSGVAQTKAQKTDVRQTAEAVVGKPSSSEAEKLRARAVLASQSDQPDQAQALMAYELWAALSLLKPDDASAHFNTGYWAQKLFRKSAQLGRSHWFSKLALHYRKALTIKADKHEAAYNWGNALAFEARAVKDSDLAEARKLWRQACEKYAQALTIKADKHEAANNWGLALAAEAQAVKDNDLAEARKLWRQACEKYAQSLAIKADKHEAANNWGSALAAEAQAVKDSDLAEARKLWLQAGEKYAQALTIKVDKNEAANNWGTVLAAEARAVKDNDLGEARKLWRQAGEKYAQALTIKADKHEAANNWGLALAAEAQAVKDSDLAEARKLWRQAGEKYAQALAIKADMHDAAYNWGGALAFEAQAVKDSGDLAEARKLWRQAGEKYAQALAIKADKHEAANDWGIALAAEAQAVKSQQADDGVWRFLLVQAAELLERYAAMDVHGRDAVAYNLACVYSLQGRLAEALAQLDICRLANKLPDHWRIDDDLEPLRSTPEYPAWLAQHFPNG